MPGTPAAAEMRPWSGVVTAALRWSPGLAAVSRERPQAPVLAAAGPGAHQLAAGPAEYFRVESPFSAVPSPGPQVPEARSLSARGATGRLGEEEKQRCRLRQVGVRVTDGGKPGLGDWKDCLCASKGDQC